MQPGHCNLATVGKSVEAAGIAPVTLFFGTHCPQCGYALSAGNAQEICREDEALRELVARWHYLISDVRVTIIEIARAAH